MDKVASLYLTEIVKSFNHFSYTCALFFFLQIIMVRRKVRGTMSSNSQEQESRPSAGGMMPQLPPSWPSRSSRNLASGSQTIQTPIEESGDIKMGIQ